MYCNFLIHVFVDGYLMHVVVDGYLGLFHDLAIVKSGAMNNGIHVSLNFGFLGPMPRSGIAGSYGGFIYRL